MSRRNTYHSFRLAPDAPILKSLGVEVPAEVLSVEGSLSYIPIFIEEDRLRTDDDVNEKRRAWGLEFILLGRCEDEGLRSARFLGDWVLPYSEVSKLVEDDILHHALPHGTLEPRKSEFLNLLQRNERPGRL